MRNVFRLAGLALVVAGATSCGDVVRDGSSPVYLVIDSLAAVRGGSSNSSPTTNLLSDVLTNTITPPPCSSTSPCPSVFDDVATITLRAPLKDIGGGATPLVPTTNNEVTISRVTVEYVRTDGRNVPGVDVPYPIDGAVTGTIPAAGTLTVGFEIVRHTAKQEAPLAELRTSPNIIVTNARVTIYGKDRTGNEVSVTGQIQINFGNFGDI
jgi:hypothetical protein